MNELVKREKAQEVYQRGIEVATSHGHPSMAEEYRRRLSNYQSRADRERQRYLQTAQTAGWLSELNCELS